MGSIQRRLMSTPRICPKARNPSNSASSLALSSNSCIRIDVPIMGHQPDGRNGDGPGHLHVIRLESLDDEGSVRLLELLIGCAEATEEVGHRDDPLIVGDEPQQLLQRASIVGCSAKTASRNMVTTPATGRRRT